MRDHVHPLPVCGFGIHRPHAPGCAGEQGRMIACGRIVDPDHPHFGMALCRHEDPPPAPPPPPIGAPVAGPGATAGPAGTGAAGGGSPGTGGTATGGTSGTGHAGAGHGSGAGAPAGGSGNGDELPPPDPVPEPPTVPFDWSKWLRGLLALIGAGLLAWLCFWLWLLLKKLGFWTFVLEFFWRLFDWLRRLREWLEGPEIPPELPPEEPPPEESTPEEEPPEEPLVCHLVHASMPANRTPVRLSKAPYTGVVDVSVSFDMLARFAAVCGRCEYRQLVRGRFEHKPGGTGAWIKKVHYTPGRQLLSETSFVDDGYGHRNWSNSNFFDRYEPGRSDGCSYIGHDEPGMTLAVGDAVHVYLEFEGYIWDIDPTTGAMVQKYYASWQVRILGRIVERDRRLLPWPNLLDHLLGRGTELLLEPVP